MQTFVKRTIAAGALAAPLALALSGVASADGFDSNTSSATPSGAVSSTTHADTGDQNGQGASFHQRDAAAGPNGASSNSTTARTGDDQSQDGSGTSFQQRDDQAGPNGASSDDTSASTNGNWDQGNGNRDQGGHNNRHSHYDHERSGGLVSNLIGSLTG